MGLTRILNFAGMSSAYFIYAQAINSQDPAQDYEYFAENMAAWGYTWEAFEVTTTDGYILTTFHVTGYVDSL